jgi:uncharacterized protein YbaP (TraB family)
MSHPRISPLSATAAVWGSQDNQFMNKIVLLLFTALFSLLVFSGAEAGLYKCTDANNRVFYQDRACQELTAAKLSTQLAQLGEKSDHRYFLWKASGVKGVVYLLGSLHFGTPDMYPLPERITDTFGAADALLVEANIQNQGVGEAAQKLFEKGLYADGSTLEDHLKAATWQKLIGLAKKLGVNEETLSAQKPWLASLTLTTQALKQAGFSEDFGVDRAFLKEAGSRKPILEMESVDEQVKLFDEFSPQEQEQMLLGSLQELARGPEIFTTIVDAWKKGDAEAIDLITRQSFDTGPVAATLFKAFFTDRNIAMTNKIDELLADGRTYFVVIGAGHLAGEQGILKLLEAKGYKISQL